MNRIVCSALLLALLSAPARTESWPPWAADVFGQQPPGRDRGLQERWPEPAPEPRERMPRGPRLQEGGARPHIAPQAPPVVAFAYDYPAASIVIDTSARKLYYVLPGNRAYQYAIGVGRQGFSWTGTEKISRKQAWPDWYPPEEMRARDPGLPEKMTGGLRNPLGAMALYLGTTLYRIHGTNDARSIGRAQSSGCFRMMNPAVLHLAGMAGIGTPVTVVRALPRQQLVRHNPAPEAKSVARPPAEAPPPALKTEADTSGASAPDAAGPAPASEVPPRPDGDRPQ
jgi:lipoprotein-anchoring transpeptidase ErfK/SrfK